MRPIDGGRGGAGAGGAAAAAADWPLSREEKRHRALVLFDAEVRAADSLLRSCAGEDSSCLQRSPRQSGASFCSLGSEARRLSLTSHCPSEASTALHLERHCPSRTPPKAATDDGSPGRPCPGTPPEGRRFSEVDHSAAHRAARKLRRAVSEAAAVLGALSSVEGQEQAQAGRRPASSRPRLSRGGWSASGGRALRGRRRSRRVSRGSLRGEEERGLDSPESDADKSEAQSGPQTQASTEFGHGFRIHDLACMRRLGEGSKNMRHRSEDPPRSARGRAPSVLALSALPTLLRPPPPLKSLESFLGETVPSFPFVQPVPHS